MRKSTDLSFLIVFLLCLFCVNGLGQTTTFTYQGRLTDMSMPANGSHDFQFALFETGGTQITPFLNVSNVNVSNGIFTVELNFGASAFPGGERFLQIAVKKPADSEYTLLSPRQRITSAPYALKAASSETAANATQLGGVAADQFVQTSDTRLSDDRNPTAGSGFYIQNSVSQQATSNFNISGKGTANIIDAATQYDLGGSRFLSNPGLFNTFVGTGTGQNNSGTTNLFVGTAAGADNTTGFRNSFVGSEAGTHNTTGFANAFFGDSSGLSNTTGQFNSFFGSAAGQQNMTGRENSYVGFNAGRLNTAGEDNSIFGYEAGHDNQGSRNTFLGHFAGRSSSTGNDNAFVGASAGLGNGTGSGNVSLGANAGAVSFTGSNNTFIGTNSGRGTAGFLNFGTAIGAGAVVSTNNTIVLGRSADTVQVPGNLNVAGTQTADIYNATTQFNLGGARMISASTLASTFVGIDAGSSNTGGSNTFVGSRAGRQNTGGFNNAFFGSNAGETSTGSNNSFFGHVSGSTNGTGSLNSFFGAFSGTDNDTGSRNSFFGVEAGRRNTVGLDNAYFGYRAGFVNTTGSANTLVGNEAGEDNIGSNNTFLGNRSGGNNLAGNNNTFLGNLAGENNISGSNNTYLGANARGTNTALTFATAIGADATVGTNNTIAIGRADGSDRIRIFGLGTNGSTALCRNANNEISTCTGSLADELYQRIEKQQREIEQQRKLISGLIEIVCGQNRTAPVCGPREEMPDDK